VVLAASSEARESISQHRERPESTTCSYLRRDGECSTLHSRRQRELPTTLAKTDRVCHLQRREYSTRKDREYNSMHSQRILFAALAERREHYVRGEWYRSLHTQKTAVFARKEMTAHFTRDECSLASPATKGIVPYTRRKRQSSLAKS
jgi:hypothetical protein